MKYLNNIIKLTFLIFLMASCGDDNDDHEHNEDAVYEYHAHINAPSSDTKVLGDTLQIKINFESHTGEVVHHINVQMFNAGDASNVIFNEPDDAHIHAHEGSYLFEKTLILSEENGISAHTDYTIKASVWGAKADEELEEEEVTFHVHMN